MSSLKDKTIASFFWKLLERGGNQLTALIVQIVMARLLAPDDFGLLAILLVIVNIGNILTQSGLNSSLVQSESIDERDFSTVLWMSLGIAAILYLFIFLLAPTLAVFYDAPIIEPALRVIALILPLSAVNAVLGARSQRNLNFKVIFKATISATLASGLLGIASALLGIGLWALIVQQITYVVTNCIALSIQSRWKPRLVFIGGRALKHFRFGWKILVPTLLETGYDSLSDMLTGKQFGSTPLGYMSQGKKYPVALDSMISGTLQPVLLSAVAKVQQDMTSVKTVMSRTLKTAFFFIAPVMITFALTAESIVTVLLGSQWLPAVPYMQIYCLTSALSSFHATNYQTYNGVGRSDLFLKTKLVTVSYGIIFLLFACFVIKDIFAVAVAYGCASIISTAVNAFPTKRLIGYSYFDQLKDIAPSIIIAAIAAGIAWTISFLTLPPLAMAILQWVVSITLYLILSKLFKLEELDYLLVTLKERIAKK